MSIVVASNSGREVTLIVTGNFVCAGISRAVAFSISIISNLNITHIIVTFPTSSLTWNDDSSRLIRDIILSDSVAVSVYVPPLSRLSGSVTVTLAAVADPSPVCGTGPIPWDCERNLTILEVGAYSCLKVNTIVVLLPAVN